MKSLVKRAIELTGVGMRACAELAFGDIRSFPVESIAGTRATYTLREAARQD